MRLLQDLVDNDWFFPDKQEQELVKAWIVYNMEDLATEHVPELAQFRPHIRLGKCFGWWNVITKSID